MKIGGIKGGGMSDIPEHFILHRIHAVFLSGDCCCFPDPDYHIQCGEFKVSDSSLIACAQAGQIFLDGTQMFFSLNNPDPQLSGVIGVDGHIIQNVIRRQVCWIQHKASLRAAVPGKYVFHPFIFDSRQLRRPVSWLQGFSGARLFQHHTVRRDFFHVISGSGDVLARLHIGDASPRKFYPGSQLRMNTEYCCQAGG